MTTNSSIDPRVDIGHVHLKVANLDRALRVLLRRARLRASGRASVRASCVRQRGRLSSPHWPEYVGKRRWRFAATAGHDGPLSRRDCATPTASRWPMRCAAWTVPGIPLDGASDHGVSEALYLRDPDQNGIELYRDRPREQWPRSRPRANWRCSPAASISTRCGPKSENARAGLFCIFRLVDRAKIGSAWRDNMPSFRRFGLLGFAALVARTMIGLSPAANCPRRRAGHRACSPITGGTTPTWRSSRGSIVTINPNARMLRPDPFSVTPFNVIEGSYLLDQCAEEFPAGTIFVAVVDPQVGTDRVPVLVRDRQGQIFRRARQRPLHARSSRGRAFPACGSSTSRSSFAPAKRFAYLPRARHLRPGRRASRHRDGPGPVSAHW